MSVIAWPVGYDDRMPTTVAAKRIALALTVVGISYFAVCRTGRP